MEAASFYCLRGERRRESGCDLVGQEYWTNQVLDLLGLWLDACVWCCSHRTSAKCLSSCGLGPLLVRWAPLPSRLKNKWRLRFGWQTVGLKRRKTHSDPLPILLWRYVCLHSSPLTLCASESNESRRKRPSIETVPRFALAEPVLPSCP